MSYKPPRLEYKSHPSYKYLPVTGIEPATANFVVSFTSNLAIRSSDNLDNKAKLPKKPCVKNEYFL